MRIKEFYGWHFPELAKIVNDNEKYVKLVNLVGDRKSLKKMDLSDLSEIVDDGEIVNQII